MRRLFLTWMCLILLPIAAAAQEQVDRFDIVINVENEEDKAVVFNLGNTFAMLAPRTSGVRRASRLDFRSGSDLVQSGAPTDKLNTALPQALAVSARRLKNMRDTCDVSRHRFADTDVLLVVHNTDTAQAQDALRCFVSGLWIYHAGGSDIVNTDDWRVPYARIISSVAGGRPAFAGFETKEN
ncbi:MAG: hypothetical protein ABJF86_04430 [Tateyamaria sp.]|uniref:hypothetical protein n=1 Tax=Tateyamaria sp. TaxID=1929288 RepID=UPI00328DA01E